MRRFSRIVPLALLWALAISATARGATVAYYRFEEGTANTVASSAPGAILDSSGNGLNGTAIDGPTYSSDVPVSTIPQTGAPDTLSMQFSGSGPGAGQSVFIPDSPQFDITGSLTIEAWFNVFAIPNVAGSIFFRGDDRGGLDPYFLNVEPGLVRFGINDAANQEALVTAPLPGLNQWVFAAGVLNTATQTMSLYVNGVLANTISTTETPLGPLDPSEEPGEAIGSVQSGFYGNFQSFDGLIDEVRLSNVALSPSQFLDASAGVPEPASIGLLSLFALGVLPRRRRA
jgi:hypothetical protein